MTAKDRADMLEADYVIVGAGAMGMAFADVIVHESDATVALIDQRARPGGHWNDAYPFVRLHQPSAFYGVNSRPLGTDALDSTGGNAGLYELASASEVLAYFDHVMNQQFLPSGRVQYFPMSIYEGDGRLVSKVSGMEHHIVARRKVVDATYMNVTVPSMRPPAYRVADGVRCIALNDLVSVQEPPARYVIVGAGKTAMDAVLWLLDNGVEPNELTWIMPRDSWILDRAKIQPGPMFALPVLESLAGQTEASAEAESIDDLFARLDAAGLLLRFDPDVEPTMYRCATVTVAELRQLQKVSDIVRLGRVVTIDEDEIVLEEGSLPAIPGALYVDCTADGLQRRPVEPVFAQKRITLQTVRTCQQVFSAAFIAHVELAYGDEQTKSELCGVVPHPNTAVDWLRCQLASTANSLRWRGDAELTEWLTRSRLDGFSSMRTGENGTPEELAVLARIVGRTPEALENLDRLIEAHDGD